MQTYSKLLIVLPCHSLEDFPIHYKGDEAASLLANWTALWHPALIASAEKKPEWHRADIPDVGFTGDAFDHNDEGHPEADTDTGICLAIIPEVAVSMLDSELLPNLEKENAVVITDQSSRAEIIRLALLSNPEAQKLTVKLDAELAGDFLALGYAFLQIQIMTRQLRYSSNLDEKHFSEAVVTAAKKATEGETELAKEALGRCFDLLLEEKNGYYPVEPELIDVVLTASTTLGKSLQKQLEVDHPLNILLTGSDAETLMTKKPETAARLKQRLEEQKAFLIGGLDEELPDPLIATESSLNQILRGRAAIKRHFGHEPQVFMRRRFGLTPAIPGLLDQLNFVGAIHATLDEGKFPTSSSCNIRWTGDDERSVLAIGDSPLSAADSGSFLGLGVRLGEAIDSAHIAAALFVHWPDNVSESYGDLVRISNYGPLFGNFVGLNDYFESVYDPGYGDSFAADEYKPPFLKQAVANKSANPISKFTNYWRQFYQLLTCRALLTQACVKSQIDASAVAEFENELSNLQSAIESALNLPLLDDGIETDLQSVFGKLVDANNRNETNTGVTTAFEVINTASFRRRISVKSESSKPGTIKNDPPVVIADCSSSGGEWVVELPPMGSTVIDFASLNSKDLLKSDPAIGEELILRNEYFELHVDEKTGGIRAIQLYGKRINLVSQQLAMRIPTQSAGNKRPLTRARYTSMVADNIKLTMESRISGSITSRGRLLDSENVVAEFQQTIRVVRGQRVIEVDLEVTPREQLSESFNHYVCSRLAWKSEASRLVANAGESRQDINSDWFVATNFMDVIQDEGRLTMLTGGLPYHRRTSRRMVDSVLIVGNEQERRFKFGIGVNVPYSMAAAVAFLTPPIQIESSADTVGKNSSRRLFHFDSKNILVTWWQPFFETPSESGSESADKRWAGVRIRLKETEGRAGNLAIRCPRPVTHAEQVKFNGEIIQSLEVSGDEPTKLSVEFGRFDYFQISIAF